MNLRRFCRQNATAIQFAILFGILFYLIYQLKNIRINHQKKKFGNLSSGNSAGSSSRLEDKKHEGHLRREKNEEFMKEDNAYAAIEADESDERKGERRRLRTSFTGDLSLLQRIELSRDYILSNIKQDGSFIYQVNLNKSVRIPDDYNLLRHAGTIYSLATINEVLPSDEVKSAIVKTTTWLTHRVAPLRTSQDHVHAVWSKEPETKAGMAEAKLGGAGLSLVSFAKAYQIDPNVVSLETMTKVAEFIKFMQKPDGQFNSKWLQGVGLTDFNSLYYPGEACLGLVLFHQTSHNDQWFSIALKGLKHLAESREKESVSNVLPDHWALISSRELLNSALLTHADRDLLVRHAQKVSNKFISEQIVSAVQPQVRYSFDSTGGLSPACTRVEALLAIMHVLEPSKLPPKITKTVENAMKFILHYQETSGPFKGGFRRQSVPRKDSRHMEIRIDNVQHCVTAIIKYYQLAQKWANQTSVM